MRFVSNKKQIYKNLDLNFCERWVQNKFIFLCKYSINLEWTINLLLYWLFC